MESYKEYFKNKKITIMGLGLLGRGVGVAKFLSKLGANLLITDLKTKEQLASSLKQLKKFKNIKYVLGKHRLEDFKNCEMVIKAAGVPLTSEFIAEAKKNKIPIEMDASLFAKLTKAKIISITGTRGKSTVTQIIYQTLKKFYKKGNVFLGGNVRGLATLPILEKTKEGDLIILELDSWQLQGFGESKISPHIAVFTNFLDDHMNYYQNDAQRYFNDKAEIFRYQFPDDFLIVSRQANEEINKRYKGENLYRRGGIIIANENKIKNLKTNLIGAHNQTNLALAYEVLKITGIKEKEIKAGIKTFKTEPGRLEFIGKIKNINYYNDTNATTPDACIAALKALYKNRKKIVLICGGADKELKFEEMLQTIKKTARAVVFIKGTATDKILKILPKDFPEYVIVDSMKSAVKEAQNFAQINDTIILSPGAASFGIFKNEYDRGDQFIKYVRSR